MNIWINAVAGSAGSTVEAVLRKCTDLKTIDKDEVKFLDLEKDIATYGARTSHGFRKQWHPNTQDELLNPEYEIAEDNIFTPLVPQWGDWTGSETLTYIRETYDDTNMFYLGPNPSNAEFAAITFSKIGVNYIDDLVSTSSHSLKNWNNKELDNWELREFLSMHWMQYWIPEMRDQWNTAKQLGFVCYDTKYIFENLDLVLLDIIDRIECTITDKTSFDFITQEWTQGQDNIWQKWENYVKYKDTIHGKANHDVDLFGEVGLEAMIQYQLREHGTELRCWNLNDFPTSSRIKEFYE